MLFLLCMKSVSARKQRSDDNIEVDVEWYLFLSGQELFLHQTPATNTDTLQHSLRVVCVQNPLDKYLLNSDYTKIISKCLSTILTSDFTF